MNHRSTVLIFCLGLALSFPLACSQKQPADVEIPLATPSPAVTVSAAPPAQAAAPSPVETPEPLEYEVEDIHGNVQVLYDGEANPELAEEAETLGEGDELITKADSHATLFLNDATAVRVSENTTVKVGQLQPNPTHGFLSRLELAGGEVLSEVEELDQSRSSFEVDAGGVVCGVRGTSFGVQRQGDKVQANTFHGAVEVARENHSQLVKAGEHSSYSFKQGFLPKRKLTPGEKKHYQSWAENYRLVRQQRAERIQRLRTNPQSPEAQKFLARRQAFRQKREQFHSQRPASGARWNKEQHPKPPLRSARREKHQAAGHPGKNFRANRENRHVERSRPSKPGNHPGPARKINRSALKMNHPGQNQNRAPVKRAVQNQPKPNAAKNNPGKDAGLGNHKVIHGKKKDTRPRQP